MVSESEWLTLVQLVWVTVLALVTMTAMALLLMRLAPRRFDPTSDRGPGLSGGPRSSE